MYVLLGILLSYVGYCFVCFTIEKRRKNKMLSSFVSNIEIYCKIDDYVSIQKILNTTINLYKFNIIDDLQFYKVFASWMDNFNLEQLQEVVKQYKKEKDICQ